MAMVLHDGPTDGRAVVGAYTHFGFALMDKDGAPTPHQNAEFNVVQDGKVLFSTTDTHEYDGLFSLDLRFTKPGPYQVTASSGEMALGVFEGIAVAPTNDGTIGVDLVATPQGPASRVVDVTLTIHDATGALAPHTDAIVEFRDARDGALYSRAHVHQHDAPVAFAQGLGAATEYVAQVVAYRAFQTGDAMDPDTIAVVAEFPIAVGPLAAPGVPMPALAPPGVLEQVGGKMSADDLTLHLMYDPNNQVGVGQTARIAALVTNDATLAPQAHVDFALSLSGPRGAVFESASLHEYDGMFEYAFTPEAPGSYDGTLTALDGATELVVPIHLQVVPPVVAAIGGTGPIVLAVEGLDAIVAGQEANLTFSAMGPLGPAAHSEVDVTIFHDGEPPLYNFKLHTHGSGLTNALLLFPHEGDWKMRVDALPTVPEPSVYPSTLFAFSVAAGTLADDALPGAVADKTAAVPGVGALLLVVVAGVALAARSVRRK